MIAKKSLKKQPKWQNNNKNKPKNQKIKKTSGSFSFLKMNFYKFLQRQNSYGLAWNLDISYSLVVLETVWDIILGMP